MELRQFEKALNSTDFKVNMEAMKFAVSQCVEGFDVQDYNEVLENALEDNNKLKYLVECFGNPLVDGEVDIYLSNEEMVNLFEDYTSHRELSQQQEIALSKLKEEEFFDIVAAGSVFTSECVFNKFSVDTISNFNVDDIKAIAHIADQNYGINFNIKNVDPVIKGVVSIVNNGNYNLEQSFAYLSSASSLLNKMVYGIDIDLAYQAELGNVAANDILNKRALEKLNAKINNTDEKFSYTNLAIKQSSIKFDKELDDLEDDYEEKPKSRMKMKF